MCIRDSNRIGQGIEFDYCCVHASYALAARGFETIMVNCNPETVSTDYDTSDRLYFEPLTYEDVMDVIDVERPDGVVVTLGGQTPLKLARMLEESGVNIMGTKPDAIDFAEDRERFAALLDKLGIMYPPAGQATSFEEAEAVAAHIGYPLLVRPSYVLGGRGMMIAYDAEHLRDYMAEAARISPDYPVYLDRFLEGAIESDVTSPVFLQNIFIGVILTATSVSITVETLKELGKLKTRSGNAILGAAIIDDVLGIIALTIVTSMADDSVSLGIVLLKIVGFFAFSGIIGLIFYKIYKKWVDEAEKELHRHTIIAFVFCLIMAFVAEEVFGVADITGAYIAGLIISNVQRSTYLESKFDTMSYLLLSPVFFASIGLKVELPKMSMTIIAFAVVLTIVAVITKIIGCGLGAKVCGYKNYQVKRIGVGMISRGEVALIVASKGAALGLMSSALLGPIIVVVVITTIITPVMLKVVFAPGTAPAAEQIVPESERVKSYYENREDNR